MFNVHLGGRKWNVSLLSNRNPGDAHSCFSQPAPQVAVSFAAYTTPHESKMHYFTQPTQIDNMLVSSQHLTPQSLSTANVIIKLIEVLKTYM